MKTSKILLLAICAILNSSCALSTGDFDWKNIYSFDFDKLIFAQTKFDELHRMCPKFVPILADNQELLVSSNPQKNFSSIRIGFDEKRKLEWIEFIFKKEKNLNGFLSIYGPPQSVDTSYDKDFDYYDYPLFKLCTGKNSEMVYSMVFYEAPEIPEQIQNLYKIFPTLNNLNISPNLRPGATLETEFTNSFPNIIAEAKDDEIRVYTLNQNLLKDYKKAELIFKNGILRFINLVPINITMKEITDIYGPPKKTTQKNNMTFCEYANFIVTLNKKNNIIGIGVFDSWKNYATNK